MDDKLLQGNEQLKETIDKAIEYIEKHNIIVETETIRTNSFELLEILKGDSNE